MSDINYAIEINTGVSVDVAQIGHTDDGYIRLITGRPEYTGAPPFPTWENTSNNTHRWCEGIIIKDGISSPVRMIDIKDGGDYATVGGMTVSVSNFNNTWDLLEDNLIYLSNKIITMYVIIDDVFYSAWSGVITDSSYSETTFTIKCDSNYRKIHKTIPPNNISKAIYPSSPIDETIPVVIGHVPYAKILQVGSNDTKIVIDYDIKNQPIYRCSFQSYVAHNYIQIITIKKPYLANELGGKYLRPVTGIDAEIGRILKIRYNDASTVGNAAGVTDYYLTKLYIDESFDTDEATVNSHAYTWLATSSSVGSMWWFEIIDANAEFIVSNNQVSEISKDEFGQTILNYFDDDTGKMYDAHGLITSIETNKGRDSIGLIRTEENRAGELTNVVYHGADIDTVYADGVGIYQPFINVNVGNSENITDLDRSTASDNIVSTPFFVYAAFGPTMPERFENVVFDIDFSSFDLRDAENICIGVDLEAIISPRLTQLTTFNVGFGWDFRLIDSYGRVVILSDDMGVNYTYEQECAAYPDDTTLDFNFLPNDYYRIGDDNGETSLYGYEDDNGNQVRQYLFMPDDLVEMIKKDNALKVRLTLNISSSGNCDIDSIKIKQIGVFSYQILETDKEKLYLKITGGEKYDTLTDTRSCYNAIRHILENYDGISSSNVEYDNIPTARSEAAGWRIGRQILDNKNSLDYLKDICKYFFIGMFVDREGKLNVSAFKEKTTSVEDFDESNIIRNSIGELKKLPIVYIYNEFVLKWGFNNGSESYDKTISINGIDSATSFPGFMVDDTGADAVKITTPNVSSCDYYDTGYGIIVFDASIETTLYLGDSITIRFTLGEIETSSVIYFAKITKVDSDTIYFDSPLIKSTVSAYGIGISNVNVYSHSSGSNAPLWMTLVQGIKEYYVANLLWSSCRDSYEKTGVVKACPDLESEWFIDEETFFEVKDMYYNTSPMLFLQNLIDWVSKQKETVPFSIPITPDNISRNLLDYVSFTDAIMTLDVMRYGWITKTKINTKSNTLDVELMLRQAEYTEVGDIIETGSASDEIEESGSETNEIVEGGS